MLIQNCSSKKSTFYSCLRSLALAGFFVFSALILPGCDYFSNRVLSQTVISVGPHKLTTQDMAKALAARLKALDALSAKDPIVIKRFKEKIISDFVVESLMLLYFEEKNLLISSAELEAKMKKLIADYPDDASFRESLSEEGITYAQWEKKIEMSLKRKAIFDQLAKTAPTPSDIELESYYENNKPQFQLREAVLLTHILVADENQAEIVKKMARTQKFTDLVPKFSMSPDAKGGGSYGWVERDIQPEFDRAFKARTGEVLPAIKLADGYHLFRVEQKRPQRIRSYNEVKDQVKREVLALRETARFSAWLDEQIKRYKVYKNNAILNGIYVETK
ncbi:MAG: peptidyl-prolyl cis-trans isomerase [Bdellovibrionaceae bacterium]|nr:peptidyl-prolyl cis-trans isomerase [Bdellovibrio sp.]